MITDYFMIKKSDIYLQTESDYFKIISDHFKFSYKRLLINMHWINLIKIVSRKYFISKFGKKQTQIKSDIF